MEVALPIKIPTPKKVEKAQEEEPVTQSPLLQMVSHDEDTSEAEVVTATGQLLEEIDRIGAMTAAFEKAKKIVADYQKEYKALVTKLEEAFCEDLGEDETYIAKGSKFRVEIGKKGTSREITDMEKVKAIMGQPLFMELATVKLADIDAYLTPPQKEEVLTTTRSGRSNKLVKN